MTLRKIATIGLALLVAGAGSAFAAAPVAASDHVKNGDDSDQYDANVNVSNATAFDSELYDAADDVDDGDDSASSETHDLAANASDGDDGDDSDTDDSEDTEGDDSDS